MARRTLPSDLESLDDDDLRDLARSLANVSLVQLLPDFVAELRMADSVEEKRKGLVFLMELAGAKAPAPKEEKDNLPLINITIGRNVHVQATSQDGEVQSVEFSTADLSAAMLEMSHVNEDLVLDV